MTKQLWIAAGLAAFVFTVPGIDLAQAQQQGAVMEQFQSAQASNLIGLPVWSSDGKEIGLVTAASTGPDGKVESIYIATGSFLGLGERNVEISADQFKDLGDRLQLSLTARETESLPDAKRRA